MPTVTPIYTNPRFRFNRAYIAGFVGSVGVTNFRLLANAVDFDYLAPLIHVNIPVKTQFEEPNTNTYTLDWVFNFDAASVTFNGTPIDAGVGVAFFPMTTEPTWRIHVLSTIAVNESNKADLVPMPGYWLPS